MRVESRRREIVDEDPTSLPVGSAPADPHHDVESAEKQTAVRRVLDTLTERERTLLLMQQQGFSHREIAEAVGTTTGSVGTMLARALRKFTEAAAELEALR